MRLQENNLIMEQYALINEKKKLPKGFVPFKKGHGKKKGKEDDKKDSKGKKKNPFASLKKESAAIYATMSEAPMTADDQQLQADAGISGTDSATPLSAKPSAEEIELLNSVAPTIGMSIKDLWWYYLDCKDERAEDEHRAGDPPTNETLADFLKSQNDMGVFDDMRRDRAESDEEEEAERRRAENGPDDDHHSNIGAPTYPVGNRNKPDPYSAR